MTKTDCTAQNRRIAFENILIFLLAALSLVLLLFSFLPSSLKAAAALQISIEMGRMVQRAFSILLLCLSVQLYKRKRTALYIALFLFLLNFLRGFTALRTPVHTLVMAVDLLFFAAFFCLRRDFCCPSSRRSCRQAAAVLILTLAGVAANAALCFRYVRALTETGARPLRETLLQSLLDSLGLLFGMGSDLPLSHGAQLLERMIFWFSWGCMLAALCYVVRPWLAQRQRNASDLQHARTLLNLYGQNSCSYLALEEDKQLYFGRQADGVIPYGVSGGTIIVNGDPVCADADFPVLLAEFKEFCQRSAHKLFFLSVTDHFLPEYERQGFGYVKCGEEARFRLADYEISGKKGAKMRMNINHARKAGITVKEYKPLTARDPAIEAAFDRVTAQWLTQKKSSLLKFTMGTAGLENPMDKRYFYGVTPQNEIVAFLVFIPFLGKRGYMADMTRHGSNAPSGVIELLIYEAFQVFRSEGVEYGSMGVAPLAGLDASASNPVEKLLTFAYNRLNDCYGFRDLYRAKEKYSPTQWLPAYYVYLPRIPTPDMFYDLVRILNPLGFQGGVRAIIKGIWNRHAGRREQSHEANS